MRKIVILFLFFICLKGFTQTSVLPPAPLLPVPTDYQMAWYEMEMNVFIHFTINTFTGKEWGYGDENPTLFDPSNTDVQQWIKVFQQAGFKGIILTAKHHDGFCLWPSAYTEHSIKNSLYRNGKGDLLRELSDACKKNGLKFGLYLSPWDRNYYDYGKPGYIEYYRNQLKELITNYGPFFEVWFDGANGGDGYYGGANEKRKINGATYYDWPNTIKLVESLQGNTIFFSDAGPGVRWVGNEDGRAGETNWNTISVDSIYAGKPGIYDLLNTGMEDGKKWIPAECDVSIRPGWFYHKEQDSLVKSPKQLFDIYLTSVGRGSVLLLNVPPDRRGLIHENDVNSLIGFRKLLDSVFKTDLALKAPVKATSFRGNNNTYSPNNMLDNDPETYWTTDDDKKTAVIEISLKQASVVNYILLQEYIKLGQRVRSFKAEAWVGNQWKTIAKATTIGYKRIIKVGPVKSTKIRISILDSKACPIISNISIY